MKYANSSIARFRLLARALEGKSTIPSELLTACRSQGGLASLDIPSEGITAMSLNTLKKCADTLIEIGGWEKLDKMRQIFSETRKNARKLTVSKSVSRIEKLGLSATEIKTSLDTERRYRIRLQVAYEELLTKVRSLANTDPDLANYVNRHTTGFSFKRLSISKSGENDAPA